MPIRGGLTPEEDECHAMVLPDCLCSANSSLTYCIDHGNGMRSLDTCKVTQSYAKLDVSML